LFLTTVTEDFVSHGSEAIRMRVYHSGMSIWQIGGVAIVTQDLRVNKSVMSIRSFTQKRSRLLNNGQKAHEKGVT
jgi:hypothetical protein